MSTAADIPASFNKPNWFERSEGCLTAKVKERGLVRPCWDSSFSGPSDLPCLHI